MTINNDMNKMLKLSEINPTKDYKCQRCGYDEFLPVVQFHHVIQKRNGGDESANNIILLCPNCHRALHQGLWGDEKYNIYKNSKEFRHGRPKKDVNWELVKELRGLGLSWNKIAQHWNKSVKTKNEKISVPTLIKRGGEEGIE